MDAHCILPESPALTRTDRRERLNHWTLVTGVAVEQSCCHDQCRNPVRPGAEASQAVQGSSRARGGEEARPGTYCRVRRADADAERTVPALAAGGVARSSYGAQQTSGLPGLMADESNGIALGVVQKRH